MVGVPRSLVIETPELVSAGQCAQQMAPAVPGMWLLQTLNGLEKHSQRRVARTMAVS